VVRHTLPLHAVGRDPSGPGADGEEPIVGPSEAPFVCPAAGIRGSWHGRIPDFRFRPIIVPPPSPSRRELEIPTLRSTKDGLELLGTKKHAVLGAYDPTVGINFARSADSAEVMVGLLRQGPIRRTSLGMTLTGSEQSEYQKYGFWPSGVVVTVTIDGLVRISLGSDDGVTRGMIFEVVREGKIMGRIEILQTMADAADCKVIPEFKKGDIMKNDGVRGVKAGAESVGERRP